MKAKLLTEDKKVLADGSIIEFVLWELPKKSKDRPHGFKYRLYYGDVNGNCLVRYDNETGKGDHMHIRDKEYPYYFVDRFKLFEDFFETIKKIQMTMEENL